MSKVDQDIDPDLRMVLCVEHMIADMEGRDFDPTSISIVEKREYDLIQRLIVYTALRTAHDAAYRLNDMTKTLEGLYNIASK